MKSSMLNSLFDEETRRPLTVSELNEQVKRALERGFSSIWLEGEIVNFMAANSGHWYFSLHDEFSHIKAACFVRSNQRIRFKPFDGLQVRVRGRISVYEPRGEYQILIESLEPVGEGALKIAFEQIKARLEREGLFAQELKRSLPYFPKRVGVVTSPNGAAFHDILNVLGRRTKTVNITLIPTRVQGETAGEEIEKAIKLANEFNQNAGPNGEKIDVLIVGRGGGSSEDLWAFNEERVARAIRSSKIPIISAVGHEIDYTIADFVADLRAATPSAAAEIVAENEEGLAQFIEQKHQSILNAISYKLVQLRANLQVAANAHIFYEFPQRIRDSAYEIEDFRERMANILANKIANQTKRIESLQARLSPLRLGAKVGENKTRLAVFNERQSTAIRKHLAILDRKLKIKMASLGALSPLTVLERGYAIATGQNGEILHDVQGVEIDDRVKILLARGSLEAKVLRKVEDSN